MRFNNDDNSSQLYQRAQFNMLLGKIVPDGNKKLNTHTNK